MDPPRHRVPHRRYLRLLPRCPRAQTAIPPPHWLGLAVLVAVKVFLLMQAAL